MPLRFCMVTTFYPPYHFGGDGVFVRALSRELAAHGHEVEVVHCEDAYRLRGQQIPDNRDRSEEDRADHGIIVHRLHSRLGMLSPLITQQTGRPGLKHEALKRILNRQFDVIHFHNVSLVGGPAVLELGHAPVKLYTAHEHWLVCPTHVLWKNRSRPCEKPECWKCCLISGTPPQLWRYTGLVQNSLRHIDALLAPSEFTAERHRAAGIECPIQILPHFATVEVPAQPHTAAPGNQRPSFLYVGRLTASKGVLELVDQFLNLPQYELLLAGDGELFEVLRRRIGQAEHIRLLGSVRHARLIAQYQRATALIVPSIGPEAFGLVAVEAMACDTPVIVREAGGSGEAVLTTGGGVIYRSNDELLSAIHRMASEPTWRDDLARKAWIGFKEHYTADAHLKSYFQIIESIQAKKQSGGAIAGNMTTIAPSPLQAASGHYPLVGHLPIFLRDRLGFLTRCAEMDAAVVKFRLDADIYLLLDAMDLKHVLEANYPNYDKSERMTSARGRELSGSGLLTSMGREHLEKRRILQPLFSPNSIEPFADIMAAEAQRFLDRWKDGAEIDAASEMSDLTQCINGRILLNADYHGIDAELAEAIRVRRQYIQHVFGSLLPFSDRLPSRARAAFNRAQSLINQDVRNRIELRRAEPGKYSDMLARFAGALDDHAALDEAVTTAITGYETIGEGLAWTCLLLAQHPHIEQKLIDEIQSVLGHRLPTNEDLRRLHYTDMVLNESMRLYPPTWIYVRMSREADVLPSGVRIPADTRLYICPWAIQRSARYFDDPLTFDPSRFETEARKARPKYAHFPFGGGPRVCIGQWIAKMQMPIMLAMLMQRFKLELSPGQNIVPDPKITLRPSPAIRMLLRSRIY